MEEKGVLMLGGVFVLGLVRGIDGIFGLLFNFQERYRRSIG